MKELRAEVPNCGLWSSEMVIASEAKQSPEIATSLRLLAMTPFNLPA